MTSNAPFGWGTTASAVGAEGAAPATDWSRWERDRRAPRSQDGSGFLTEFRDDLALLADLGFTEHRLTAEWARIEPRAGEVDGEAVDRYRDILRAARDLGLRTWLTLQHTSLPGWFSDDERGFRDARSTDRFWRRHVDRCAESFDGLVDVWVPMDDPVRFAVRGHLLGSRPPGLRDPEKARMAIDGTLEAFFDACLLLGTGRAVVASAMGTPSIFPADPDAGDQARFWDALLWDSWVRAMVDGEFGLPWRSTRSRPDLVDAVDIIGVNFDHPIEVDRDGVLGPHPPGDRTDDTGFAPNASELGEVLRRLADLAPGRPLAITANGVSTTDDDFREEQVTAVLGQLSAARADGIPVQAYFHDTAVDGYEWRHGFGTERGIIDRDRRVKASGEAFRRVLAREQPS